MTGQQEVVAFLASPAAFGGARPVERIDTHFSIVFIAGDTVLKLKRDVSNELLDYGSAERRREACEAELRLNRRTAPTLYRDVLPVTRAPDGSLALGGEGQPLDWVVVMGRFDDGGLFLDLARDGRLTGDLVDRATDSIAAFHAGAEATPARGGAEDMAWIVAGNRSALAELAGDALPAAAVERLNRLTDEALEAASPLLERRRQNGRTRRCHGDLHLGNICLVDGVPTLFDAVEFNERIACCDLLYDLAFLVMDLWDRGHPALATRVLNRWLWRTGDWEALPLLPLFLSCRAAVRAKTSAWAATTQDARSGADERLGEARAYLGLALAALDRPSPRMVALGGLSGTGKTTLAMALAADAGPVPGAVVLRSDVLRKQLSGVAFDRRLDPARYDTATTDAVYRRLCDLAGAVLDAGLPAIADAVFLREAEREAVEAVAVCRGHGFRGLWLQAPAQTLSGRVADRRGDASDADAAVVRFQAAEDPGIVRWQPIDATGGPDETLARARRAL